MNNELKSRIVTALIGAPLLIALVSWGGRLGCAIVAVVLSLAMVREYSKMVFSLSDAKEKTYLMLGLTWIFSFINFWTAREEATLFLFLFFVLFFYFLFTSPRHSENATRTHFTELVLSLFGMAYLWLLPLYLVLIRDYPNGGAWTTLLFLIIWATDTGGYFAGKYYGKRKLFPSVSPKKTVEGALGGFGLSLLVACVYKLTLITSFSWVGVVILPLTVSSFSQVGDLCESFLKRAFDRKDSGTSLPGHGGFMDRFDGLLFGLPVMYACVRIFS